MLPTPVPNEVARRFQRIHCSHPASTQSTSRIPWALAEYPRHHGRVRYQLLCFAILSMAEVGIYYTDTFYPCLYKQLPIHLPGLDNEAFQMESSQVVIYGLYQI